MRNIAISLISKKTNESTGEIIIKYKQSEDMMKMKLVLAGVVSIALVLGCGKKSEENVAEKQIEHETGSEVNANISNDSVKVKAKNDELQMEADNKTMNLKQEGNVKTEQATLVTVTDVNFESEVLKSDIPVMVDFWAPWCRPCLIAAPVLEKIAEQYQGRLKVCKLNVDEARQTAMKYGIRSIPTLNIYKHGELVDQMIGVTPNYEFDLKKKIESHL